MAEASILVAEDQFVCPVCLELLKDPVTVPCGHSFCKMCINGCWDQEDQKRVYSCPQCRKTFTPRPVLCRNNMLSEVVEKLKKKTELQAASAAHCYAGAAYVECDSCTGRKRKAVKSCLTCLVSYCETHIKPHYQSVAFKKHKLVAASCKLQEKICSQHDEVLKIYCHTDQSCICYLCTMHEHRGHNTVAAVAERTDKQRELHVHQKQCEQRLQEKQKKVEEVKQAMETFKCSAQTAVEDSEKIFTELIFSMKKRSSEMTELIRDQEKAELSRADRVLEQLEQEISDLTKRNAELQQLSHTEDHIHFLQRYQSLCVPSRSEDSFNISVHQHPSFDAVGKSLSSLKERLEEFCGKEFNNIPPHDFCHLTLDPDTAHCCLILSEENRAATNNDISQHYSDHPERFDCWPQVLCKESVCGRCYWELEWSREEYGVYISVSYKDISRKGEGSECLFGRNNQSWSLHCSSSLTFWHNNIKTEISASPSARIGVYLDHIAGTLSFYSVSDTMRLLHTEHTTFTQPLYPGFIVCYKSTVRLCTPK